MPHWITLMIDSFWQLLAAGVKFTVPLALFAFAGGITLAFVTALTRLYGHPVAKAIARFYVWVIRGTPLLVQLFIIFYGLPKLGIIFDPFPAVLLGFILSVGAYASETIRAAISSIPKGQWEASKVLGMTWFQTMRRTVVPQAARVATPSLANSFISLVKDTSLAAALTVPELFQTAQRISSVVYEPLVLYSEAAIIYLAFSSVLSTLQTRLEKNLDRHVATEAS